MIASKLLRKIVRFPMFSAKFCTSCQVISSFVQKFSIFFKSWLFCNIFWKFLTRSSNRYFSHNFHHRKLIISNRYFTYIVVKCMYVWFSVNVSRREKNVLYHVIVKRSMQKLQVYTIIFCLKFVIKIIYGLERRKYTI